MGSIIDWWPILFVVAAVCMSLIGKLLRFKTSLPDFADDAPTIFVGLVAYCDAEWPDSVLHLLERANRRHRVTVGVLEFVRTAEDSCEDRIPNHMRGHIRVHTLSERVATSLRGARALCIQELLSKESYVLLARGCDVVDGWDEKVFDQLPDEGVLSARLPTDWTTLYPCIRPNGTVSYKELKVFDSSPVDSLRVSFDFVFCPNQCVDTILSSSNEWDVTARLAGEGFSIYVPGIVLCKRSETPRGVKAAKRPVSREGLQHVKAVGGVKPMTALARLGVTPLASATELVAKFGSLVAARVEIQSVEAENKRGLASKEHDD